MATPGTRRRDLLHPERMAALAAAALPRVPPDLEAVPDELIRAGRQAMACRFEIFLSTRDRSRIMTVHQALDLIQELEGQMTVFRNDSEIAHLNRYAFEATDSCRDRPLRAAAAGSENLSRDRRSLRHDSRSALESLGILPAPGYPSRSGGGRGVLEAGVGSRFLELDPSARNRSLPAPRSGIESGSDRKGVRAGPGRPAVESRKGTEPHSAPRRPQQHFGPREKAPDGNRRSGWKVSIRDPLGRTGPLATVELRNRALSTSGVRRTVLSDRK